MRNEFGENVNGGLGIYIGSVEEGGKKVRKREFREGKRVEYSMD